MKWKAKWIAHPDDNRESRLVPVFRREFFLETLPSKAILYVSSHGIYDCYINGWEVTGDRFAPGLTSYYYRIQYGRYNVTALLQRGTNIWQSAVGDGWWRWNNNFGGRLAFSGWLELTFVEDGQEQTKILPTDERFQVGCGPWLHADLQQGEIYDARRQAGGWVAPLLVHEHVDARMIEMKIPVREHETFPGRPFRDAAGHLVIDFGQNLAGYVRMKLRHTAPGQRIHLQHGEDIDANGSFSVANINDPMNYKPVFQEITYLCRGCESAEDAEVYCPKFSYAGFRYLLVEGYDPKWIREGDFTAVAVYSDLEDTGDFHCSNPLIDQLVRNARWSQKGNFLDCPVDCPTRERNTWDGDAQIYVRTACWFMDVYDFFAKWLKDQTIEQYASGKVGITFPSTSSVHDPEEFERIKSRDPHMAIAGPSGNGNIGEDSVGWGDSAVWIPYQLYLMYGNPEILRNQYGTAKKWVDYSLRCMKDPNPLYADRPWYRNGDGDLIYDTRFHYGEWNEPLPPSPEVIAFFQSGHTAPEYVEYMAKYGKPEVATAYTCRSCDNLAHMARILGFCEDAAYYQKMADRIRTAYDRYMISEEGVIQPGHEAAYVRALALHLVSSRKKPLVLRQLKQEIEAAGYHLNTGFLSTVYLLPTLVDNGLVEEAYRILEQTDNPSWLHPITLGATTMLEAFDGMDTHRESYNHYSLGSVCQFLFEYTAGIRPTFRGPGFREFDLKPVPGGSLTWAEASYRTKFGTIRSGWKKEGGTFTYHCCIPRGTRAQLTLPDGTQHALTAGEYEFRTAL